MIDIVIYVDARPVWNLFAPQPPLGCLHLALTALHEPKSVNPIINPLKKRLTNKPPLIIITLPVPQIPNLALL
jgi:hypothetical protein